MERVHWAVWDEWMRRSTACGQPLGVLIRAGREDRVTCPTCKEFLAAKERAAKKRAESIRKRMRSAGYDV